MDNILYALTAALVFIGFITNAFTRLPFNFGTLVVDVCYVVLFATVAWAWLREKRLVMRPRGLWTAYALLAAWAAVLLCLPLGTPYERTMGFRNYVVYPGVFFVLLTSPCNVNSRKVADILWWSGLAVCGFAIVQAFAFKSMPPLLLSLGGKEVMFDINDGEIFRVNGLVGTTIVFATFAALVLFCGFSRKERWQKFLSAIPALALYLCYSRIALLATAAVLMVGFLWTLGSRLPRDLRYAALALIAFAISSLSPTACDFVRNRTDRDAIRDAHFARSGEGVIVNRLTGSDKITRKSTVAHIEQYRKGLAAIAEHPWVGVGLGTQGCSSRENGRFSIVQDGFYLATALELGTVGFVLYFLIFAGALGFAFWRWKDMPREAKSKSCISVFLAWGAFALICNFVNSSFASRINQCLFWILAGLSCRSDRGG